MKGRKGPVLLALAACAVLVAGPAYAGETKPSSNGLIIRSVDSTDPRGVTVTFEYPGDAADVANAQLNEAGRKVDLEQPPAQVAAANRGIMFVVDASKSTDGSSVLAEAKDAVAALVAKLPGVRIGLIEASTQTSLDQRFTTDPGAVGKALDGIHPRGDGTLWEAVDRAVGQFSGEDMLPTVVVITDGVSQPTTAFAEAQSAVSNAGAEVDVLGVQTGALTSEVRQLADASGGSYLETNDPAQLSDLVQQLVPRLTGQYQVTYASGAEDGLSALTLSVKDAVTRVSFVPGSVQVGVAALTYEQPSTGGSGLFGSSAAKFLGIVLGMVAAALGAFALINLLVKDESALSQVLRPYDGYTATATEEESDNTQTLATSALLQRAVAMTEQFAEKQGYLTKVEAALERANLPIRAAEAMFFYAASVGVLTLLSLVLTRQLLMAAVVLALGILTPPGVLNFLASRRKKKFEAMLPDMLQLMSATLRAGYSMQQAVDAVAQEIGDPMGRELRRVTTEARLGRPLEEALDAVAERMDSKDFGWAVMAIRIQREVGGNLAELLMTVADTMTERERLRREVRALTAEGRMSAYVLGILPIGLAGVLWMMNPDYMSPLIDDTRGNVLLGLAGVGMVGGFAWMSKIIKVEI